MSRGSHDVVLADKYRTMVRRSESRFKKLMFQNVLQRDMARKELYSITQTLIFHFFFHSCQRVYDLFCFFVEFSVFVPKVFQDF